LQTLRIKWSSFEKRLSKHRNNESLEGRDSKKLISIIDTTTKMSCAIATILSTKTQGRFLVSGPNGSGKSTLCLNLKGDKDDVFYLPAKYENPNFDIKGSTGQLKLAELKWLAENRLHYSMILLDEWDANLDADATSFGDSLIQDMATSCLVLEVRHKI
jgi:Fe-S cluster assembly ATPase SufC